MLRHKHKYMPRLLAIVETGEGIKVFHGDTHEEVAGKIDDSGLLENLELLCFYEAKYFAFKEELKNGRCKHIAGKFER